MPRVSLLLLLVAVCAASLSAAGAAVLRAAPRGGVDAVLARIDDVLAKELDIVAKEEDDATAAVSADAHRFSLADWKAKAKELKDSATHKLLIAKAKWAKLTAGHEVALVGVKIAVGIAIAIATAATAGAAPGLAAAITLIKAGYDAATGIQDFSAKMGEIKDSELGLGAKAACGAKEAGGFIMGVVMDTFSLFLPGAAMAAEGIQELTQIPWSEVSEAVGASGAPAAVKEGAESMASDAEGAGKDSAFAKATAAFKFSCDTLTYDEPEFTDIKLCAGDANVVWSTEANPLYAHPSPTC